MATIRDIAKEAGVSASAVSRILNNDLSLGVSPETRKKVIDTANSLGYKKAPRVNTVSKAAFSLGLVLWYTAEEEIKDTYYVKARQGVEDFCIKHAIDIIRIYPHEADIDSKLENVNGLICLGKFSNSDIDKFVNICNNIVFLDMAVENHNITSLSMDFEQAVYSALNYLSELGHEKIAYLGGKEYLENNEPLTDARTVAFEKYMIHRNIDYKPYFREGSFSLASGYEMMLSLIDSGNIPTAVFSASDAIAFGAMKAIKERGLSIPDDISIIGFNDEETSSFMNPALTTIHAPSYDMGQHGANLLFVASNLSIKTPLRAKIPCELVIRESCKKAD